MINDEVTRKLRLKYIISFIIGLVIMLLGGFLVILPVSMFTNLSYEEILKQYGYLMMLVPEIIGIIIAGIVYKKRAIVDGKDFNQNKKKYSLYILYTFLVLTGVTLIFALIRQAAGIKVSSENQEVIYNMLRGNKKFFIILQVAIIAPIFEEILFRFFPVSALKLTNIHKSLVILIPAFIFAIMHCGQEDFTTFASWLALFEYLSLSLCLTYLFYKTDNIMVSITGHAINNIFAIVLFYIGG